VDPLVKVKTRFHACVVWTEPLLTQQVHNPVVVIKVDDAPHSYAPSEMMPQQTAMTTHKPERASMVMDVAWGYRGERAMGTRDKTLHT
jgi:hypothetical protein